MDKELASVAGNQGSPFRKEEDIGIPREPRVWLDNVRVKQGEQHNFGIPNNTTSPFATCSYIKSPKSNLQMELHSWIVYTLSSSFVRFGKWMFYFGKASSAAY